MFPLATVAPTTMDGRIAVVLLGVAILILTLLGADVIEPILVAVGVGFVVVGLRGESRSSVAPPARAPSEGSEAGGEEGRR